MTWSGLSSNTDLVGNVARIAAPTLLVHAAALVDVVGPWIEERLA